MFPSGLSGGSPYSAAVCVRYFVIDVYG
jgi:hypothetical protein